MRTDHTRSPAAAVRRSAPSRPRWSLLVGPVLACGLMAAGAEPSPYYVGVSQTLTQASNQLQLADGQSAPPGFSRSDLVATTALVAGLDQPIGRQRLQASGSWRINRYDRNSRYDNQGYALNGALDWSTAERVSGTVAATATRALSSLYLQEVGLVEGRNLERVESLDATLRLGLVTALSFELGAGTRRSHNSLDLDAVQARNHEQDQASAGIRWQPRAGSSLGAAVIQTRSHYPRFMRTAGGYEAERFRHDGVELTAGVQISGASRFDLKLADGRTRVDGSGPRHFDTASASLAWTWTPAARLHVVTTLAREKGQDAYPTRAAGQPAVADYARDADVQELRLTYAWTAKVGMALTYRASQRELVRTLRASGAVLAEDGGRERYEFWTLGVRWLPAPPWQLGCDVGDDRRRTQVSVFSYPYTNHTVGCAAQYTWR